MDEQAFAAGTEEEQVGDVWTVLMAGGAGALFKNKKGHLLITNDRMLFSDQRFSAKQSRAVGGMLAGALAGALEKMRSEGRPPMIDLPLTDITRVSHVTKMTVRDIIVIEAGGHEFQFAQGFKSLSPILRRALTERHGKTVADDGDDAWRVSA
jgi:hypothetical protein